MLKFTPYYVFKIAFAELMHPIIQLHSIEMKIYKNNQREQPKIDTFKGGSVNRSLTDCIQINRLIVAGIDMHFKNASTCIYILNIHQKNALYARALCTQKDTHTHNRYGTARANVSKWTLDTPMCQHQIFVCLILR